MADTETPRLVWYVRCKFKATGEAMRPEGPYSSEHIAKSRMEESAPQFPEVEMWIEFEPASE